MTFCVGIFSKSFQLLKISSRDPLYRGEGGREEEDSHSIMSKLYSPKSRSFSQSLFMYLNYLKGFPFDLFFLSSLPPHLQTDLTMDYGFFT